MCRDEEIKILVRQIQRAVDGVRIEHYIFGTTGIGKTYVVRGVLREAKKEYEDFEYAWVNCKMVKPLSPFQFYKEIISQLGGSDKAKKGLASSDLKKTFLSMTEGKKFVLVLDEVDALVYAKPKQTDLLYDLRDNKVSQILISNVFDWVTRTEDMRLQSRASSDKLVFKNYSIDEMVEVLKFIVDVGVNEGVLSDDILKEISKYTIENLICDVRKGKNLISTSVQEAMNENKQQVTLAHVEKAFENVQSVTLTQILRNFTKPELLALSGYVQCMNDLEKKPIASTENIHRFYRLICERNNIKPVEETMMKNYLSQLEGSKILSHETKSYERRGRTNIYYSDYSVRELDRALMQCNIFIETGHLDENEVWTGKKQDIDETLSTRYDRE